tara:strand:- start:1541 stop:1798 length:258 start_codon:yes stop_codon:yes gene_type:complete
MRLIKNKSFRKFSYVILFLIGIFNFPSIGFLLFTILVIAFMFDSGIQNSNIKDVQIKNNTQKKLNLMILNYKKLWMILSQMIFPK